MKKHVAIAALLISSSICYSNETTEKSFLLTGQELSRLSDSEQRQYLNSIKSILADSAKKSEFFVKIILKSLLPEAYSIENPNPGSRSMSGTVNNLPTPHNIEYTIQALIDIPNRNTSIEHKKEAVALAKIYLEIGKSIYPEYDFSKSSQKVKEKYDPLAVQNYQWAQNIQEAIGAGGDRLLQLANGNYLDLKRAWDIQPGGTKKNPERIVIPGDFNLDKNRLNQQKNSLNFEGGRCLYAGFVIRGSSCQYKSKIPSDFFPLMPKELEHFSCSSPTPVLCNPFVFGCHTVGGIKPLCVVAGQNATRLCERQSDARATTCALGVIQENPKPWQAFSNDLKELCLPENIANNGFMKFKNKGVARSESSEKRARADLEKTCELTVSELSKLTDIYRDRTLTKAKKSETAQ